MVTPPHFTDVASPWTTMLLLGDLGRTMVRTLASRLNQPTGFPALEPDFVLRLFARKYRTALLVGGNSSEAIIQAGEAGRPHPRHRCRALYVIG
jgi:hypothetical protein